MWKDLREGKKVLVLKEIAKVKKNESIDKRVNSCVITEISESGRILEKSFKEKTSV